MSKKFYLLTHPNKRYAQFRKSRRTGNHGGRLTGLIVLHDAENVTDLVGEDTGAEAVARYISTRDTPGSYHEITDRDSRVPMAPFEYEVWHDTTSNNYAIGIAVAWRKSDLPRMTKAQRVSYYRPFAQAVLDAVAWLKKNRGITVPIGGFISRSQAVAGRPGLTTHSRMDPSRRSDPFGTGSRFEAEFLATLAEIAGKPAPKPSTPPSKPSTPPSSGSGKVWPDVAVPTTDEHTTASHNAWVALMSSIGYRDKKLGLALQRWLKARGFYSGRLDGVFGPLSVKALQRFLASKGLYRGRIDGIRGAMTVRAEIAYLNDQRKYQ